LTPLAASVLDRAVTQLERVRPFFGTLVVLPLVVVVFGSHWTWERSVTPSRVWKAAARGSQPDQGQEVRLHFYDEGSDPGRGVELGDGSLLLAELPREVSSFEIVLQVDANDYYLVLGGPGRDTLQPLWKVRRDRSESVLVTVRSPRLDVVTPIRFVQVEGLRGVGARSVAGLRLDLPSLQVSHAFLVPLVWGAWLLLAVAGRHRRGRWANAVRRSWRRIDPGAAALLIGAVVLRTPDVVVYSLLVVGAIWAVLRLLSA
jgi:hypothetical protein